MRAIKNDNRIETQASWEKFCNSISLQTSQSESQHKINNFLKPKGQQDYPNMQKVQPFDESVERHVGIQSDKFDSNHFHEVNQFIEDNHKYFYPPEDLDD